MQLTTNMWHPAGEARQYEAAGSRTSFNERWNADAHCFEPSEALVDPLQLMIEVSTDEQKSRWHYSFEPAA
jgi:hypothetical protein